MLILALLQFVRALFKKQLQPDFDTVLIVFGVTTCQVNEKAQVWVTLAVHLQIPWVIN